MRSGFSRRSASARAKISSGTFGDNARGLGLSASNPPARHALIQSSAVERATRTATPSGPTWGTSHRARTSRPRWRVESAGSAASWITE